MKNIPNASDYLEKAKQGDISAQKQLGMLLVRSNDTLNDGISWLKKAANSDSDAMYLLGRIYLRKHNDAKQAFYWYEKAAQNDHTDNHSCGVLGSVLGHTLKLQAHIDDSAQLFVGFVDF